MSRSFLWWRKKGYFNRLLVVLWLLISLLTQPFVVYAQTSTASATFESTASANLAATSSATLQPSPTPESTPSATPLPTPTSQGTSSASLITPPLPTPTALLTVTPTITPTPEPLPVDNSLELEVTPEPAILGESTQEESASLTSLPTSHLPKVWLKKQLFKSTENLTLEMEIDSKIPQVLLTDPTGLTYLYRPLVVNNYPNSKLIINKPAEFKPGKYQLKVQYDGAVILTDEFYWGVLAINSNKSVYAPNELAQLQMAVLDEGGNMICDAQLELKIISPDGTVTTKKTTDGSIIINEECFIHNYTTKPDYETSYQTTLPGTYQLTLNAQIGEESYQINDSFSVETDVQFDVEREAVTRVYPAAKYPVGIKITANEDFSGEIIERVPDNFDISPANSGLRYSEIRPEATSSASVLGTNVEAITKPFSGNYPISQEFGEYLSGYNLPPHTGIDYALPNGEPILAAANGKVIYADEGVFGLTVILEHEWGKTYYGHLSTISAVLDTDVTQGTVIAYSGDTGFSTGPHLHFAVTPNDVTNIPNILGWVNPHYYLQDTDVLGINTSAPTVGYKNIVWDISLQKGETANLNYLYDAPDQSPELYTLGPLIFQTDEKIVFEEQRAWQLAIDTVAANGWMAYADTANAGKLKIQKLTNPATWGSEVNTTLGGGTTDIYWTEIAQDPTSNEIHVAYIDSGGTMYVLRCSGSCDTTGNWSELFNVASVSGTQTCGGGTPVNCIRPFDIAYEQLTGRVMIAYAKTATTDAFYYQIYTKGVQTVGETSVSVSLSGYAATWISLKPRGDRLSHVRNNQILATIVGDDTTSQGNDDIAAGIWSGSAWENTQNLASTAGATQCALSQCADGAWETVSGNAIVTWLPSGQTTLKYRLFNGSSWETAADGAVGTPLANQGGWVEMSSAPLSDRMITGVVNRVGTPSYSGQVWKADGSTASWTALTGDTTVESGGPRIVYPIWERNSNDAVVLYGDASGNMDRDWETVSCDGSGCTSSLSNNSLMNISTSCGSATDDVSSITGGGSWGNDEIMFLFADYDQKLYYDRWSGSAMDSFNTEPLECSLPPGTANTNQFKNTPSFSYIPHSSWQNNWRFTDDTSNLDPANWLAAENATPSAVAVTGKTIRLRMNFAELGGSNQSDTRKKLQYSTDQSTWTDVDAQAGSGIWRYANCSAYSDDGTITTTRLTGSSTSGQSHYTWENGTSSSVADHNAGKVMEVDYCLQSNGASNDTTYYFRAYDNDLLTPVFKQQTASPWAACAGSVLCSYPALVTASAVSNQSPNSPTSLTQKKTDNSTITTGAWISDTSVKFTVSASDPDSSDTLYLCIEKDTTSTTFSNSEDSCGTGVSYSGTPVALEHTLSGLTDATAYHWHARVKDTAGAYSSWVSYGGNSDTVTADQDFGLDTTGPTGGTVYDGNSGGVDMSFNDGSLSVLSANWSGFNANAAGLSSYDYSIGTSAGAQDVKAWTSNSTNTSVTVSSLSLQSSKMYYFNVRANDNAGNSSTVSSNGQLVAPTISFSLSTSTVNFANLNAGNSYQDSKNTVLTTSTNAYNGYVVRSYKTDFLRSVLYPSTYITDFSAGSYASPAEWTAGNYGLGYSSSDTTIQGSSKFPASGACPGGGTAPCYAPFNSTAPGDIVADHTSTVTTNPISNEQYTLTYKVAAQSSQPASPYSTTLVYTVTPQY